MSGMGKDSQKSNRLMEAVFQKDSDFVADKHFSYGSGIGTSNNSGGNQVPCVPAGKRSCFGKNVL
jgi:hypothetical protein